MNKKKSEFLLHSGPSLTNRNPDFKPYLSNKVTLELEEDQEPVIKEPEQFERYAQWHETDSEEEQEEIHPLKDSQEKTSNKVETPPPLQKDFSKRQTISDLSQLQPEKKINMIPNRITTPAMTIEEIKELEKKYNTPSGVSENKGVRKSWIPNPFGGNGEVTKTFPLLGRMKGKDKEEIKEKRGSTDEKTAKRKTQDKRKKEEIDKSYTGYQVNFLSVFTIKDMKEGFMKHLEKESNTEPFEFLLEIEKLPNNISKESITKFHQIIDEYIVDNAEKSLNLSGIVRKKVIEISNNNKEKWEIKETPLEVLEQSRQTIFNDMKMDSFWRFIYSDFGYDIVIKNQDNNEVISQSPITCIMYKIKASFYGEQFSDEIELTKFASNLMDKRKMRDTYLSTNWAETQKFMNTIRSSFIKKVLHNEDEKILGVSDRQFQGNIKIKILILDRRGKEKPRKQGFVSFLSPIISAIGKGDTGEESEDYQTALMIGPYLLDWDESELCIPKKCVSNAAVFSADVEGLGSIKNLDEILDKLSETIVDWNIKKGFKKVSDNKEKCGNSQDFVECILEAIGLKITLPEYFSKFLNKIKEKGQSKLEFNPSNEFSKKFGLKEPSIVFSSHSQLDFFVSKLYEIDSNFDWNWKGEYQFLKSFDRAFWMKHLNIKVEISKLNSTIKIEKNEKVFEKLSKDLVQLEEENEKCKPNYKRERTQRGLIDCCPFKDPTKTQSILF